MAFLDKVDSLLIDIKWELKNMFLNADVSSVNLKREMINSRKKAKRL